MLYDGGLRPSKPAPRGPMQTETANAPTHKLEDTEEARRLASIAAGRGWRRWGRRSTGR